MNGDIWFYVSVVFNLCTHTQEVASATTQQTQQSSQCHGHHQTSTLRNLMSERYLIKVTFHGLFNVKPV
jgi:hypothetical protein